MNIWKVYKYINIYMNYHENIFFMNYHELKGSKGYKSESE